MNTPANYLAIMNADGTGVLNLPATGISDYSPFNPAWSPDGSKISYSYAKRNTAAHVVLNHGVAVVNADGSANHALAITSAINWNGWISSWSADGSEIYLDSNQRSTTSGYVLTDASVFATDTNGKQRTTVAPGSYNAATGADTLAYSPSFVGPGPGTGTASTYVPVTPTRIVTQTPLGQGATMSVQVAGGSSPVPADATAVTLNLTGVSPTHSTYLQAYPKVLGSSAVPKVSNLNLSQGQKAAVAVQVAVGSGGNVVIRNAFGTVGVIVDVSGYFVAGTGGAGYAPLTVPSRAYDGTLVGKSSHTVDLSGLAPTGAVAAVVNLTAANPSQTTYLAVTPDPVPAGSNPTVSNLNLPAHATRANLVTVPLSAGGTVSVFNYTGSVRAIVDVSGFYTSQAGHLAYYPLTPTRVLDTRYATNTYLGSTAPIGSGRTYYFTLGQTTTTADGIVTVPAGAQAVAYNVTAVLPTANTYLTVYGDPTTNARPTASNLNLAAGATVPNMVIAALPANRLIGIYNLTGSTPVLADLNGYYAP